MPAQKEKSPHSEMVLSFEAAMERLENIVGKMESAQLPLDELLLSYEEGTRLIGHCQDKLTAAEQRIEMVARKTPEIPPQKSTSADSSPTSSIPAPDVSLF